MAEQQKEFEETRRRLTTELDTERQAKDQVQMSSNVSISELQTEVKQLKEELEAVSGQKVHFETKASELEEAKHSALLQNEEKYKSEIRSLENELDEKKAQAKRDLEELNRHTEEQIQVLRANAE